MARDKNGATLNNDRAHRITSGLCMFSASILLEKHAHAPVISNSAACISILSFACVFFDSVLLKKAGAGSVN